MKSIFVTGTGTDVGKTYITALLLKKMREYGFDAGYYKAALSGIEDIEDCDAGIVKRIAGLNDDIDDIVSFKYKTSVSPHLASKIEGDPVEMKRILTDYNKISEKYKYLLVEGSGGIICPLRYDDKKIMLEDVVKELGLDVIVVSNAILGSINSCVLTISYLKSKNIGIKGIIINNYEKSEMQDDNIYMIRELTGIEILSVVGKNSEFINIDKKCIEKIFC